MKKWLQSLLSSHLCLPSEENRKMKNRQPKIIILKWRLTFFVEQRVVAKNTPRQLTTFDWFLMILPESQILTVKGPYDCLIILSKSAISQLPKYRSRCYHYDGQLLSANWQNGLKTPADMLGASTSQLPSNKICIS